MGHQPAHLIVPGPSVREDEEFVVGVELHEVPACLPLPDPAAKSAQGEHLLHERLPEGRILKTSFLLHGDQREMIHEGLREHSGSDVRRDSVPAVDLDALHPGARRVFLANIAAQVQTLEGLQLLADPALHSPGVIHAGFYGDQARMGGIPRKAHRLARRGKPAFRLGTDREILDEPSQRFHEKRIALVAAVVADFFAQQAGTDEDPDRSVRQIGQGHRSPAPGISNRVFQYNTHNEGDDGMKRSRYLLTFLMIALVHPADAGFMEDLIKGAGLGQTSAPGNDQVIAGLKEALSIGTGNAVVRFLEDQTVTSATRPSRSSFPKRSGKLRMSWGRWDIRKRWTISCSA